MCESAEETAAECDSDDRRDCRNALRLSKVVYTSDLHIVVGGIPNLSPNFSRSSSSDVSL